MISNFCFCFSLFEYLLTRFLIMVCRLFYASSACIYPEFKQLDTSNVSLKESDAWPAEVSAEFFAFKYVHYEMCFRHF